MNIKNKESIETDPIDSQFLNLDKLDINIQKYGGAFEVDATTVPDGLKVVKTTGTHYEIQPTRAMKENEFLDLMKQIKLKNTNKI